MTRIPAADKDGDATSPVLPGWYAVARSDDIAAGGVATLSLFGKEFVAWRGEDGQLRAVDPYCPHLGAHLGDGGTVTGNELRCPVHHWSLNGEGVVTNLRFGASGARKPLCIGAWAIREAQGQVDVWYPPRPTTSDPA
jgi:3-ketosteroid 9alpha-monooxygenase subunit A